MSRFRTNLPRSAKRREELRRSLPKPSLGWLSILQRPELINATLILLVFLTLISGLIVWSRDQVKVRDGQIMSSTRLDRLDYTVEDVEATTAKREAARKAAPRVYRPNESYLARLEASLLGLPKVVAGKNSVNEIVPELIKEFGLDDTALRELHFMAVNGEPTAEWTRSVATLIQVQLGHAPILDSQEFTPYTMRPNKLLMQSSGDLVAPGRDAMEIRPDAAGPEPILTEMVLKSGFPPKLVPFIVTKIRNDAEPTFVFDPDQTGKFEQNAISAVPAQLVKHVTGNVLYRRGDVLSTDQYRDVRKESDTFNARSGPWIIWQPRLGIIGLVGLATIFLGSFAMIAYPKMVRNPLRFGAVCTLMAAMLGITVGLTAYAPMFLFPAAIGPTLFVAIILLLAYDQRFALLLSGMQCAFITLALEQEAGFFLMLLCGCATAIVQLRELRTRQALIRAASGTAAILGVATIALGLFEVPMVPGASQQILIMALSAVLTSYGISFLVLGILPSIEKLFDITTGMTLAELRDPKRPLLRQLQQKAPGTYNHSLQVANIAEAAAEAIEADSLLVFVGALYHDIGKINKPEYFVENQSGGFNKHDKLSPAMSLLVIIGHVKDGIELAREYSLPRQIQHFIESHHGTTLVEYFYHAAKNRAELEDQSEIPETEFRYPGPKPRTKEAAILMLSDAVESATRAMAEPNPGRIENLVRKLSRKRLEDGQFDQCDLTFRELHLIEDSIISRLCAIHHSRISYPSSQSGNGSATVRTEAADNPRLTPPLAKPA
jgi:putative nucleotidyltransferase with HDIG domain